MNHEIEAVARVAAVPVKKIGGLSRFVPKSVTRTVGRQILIAQKHSPAILFGVGVVGVVATVVTASRATLHVDELILQDVEKDMQRIRAARELQPETYTQKSMNHDMLLVYVQTAGKFTKLYGPSILLGVASIAALTGSFRIQQHRIGALGAAYTALDQGFRQYRARVVEEYGEDKDREFRHGVRHDIVTVEDTNGPKKKRVKSAIGGEGYSVVFGPDNVNWEPVPEFSLIFLKAQQKYANDLLHTRGHVFLNDVYDSIGVERTSAGSVVGWVRENGDNFVDFGIWDDNDIDKFHDFMVGNDKSIVLDFNVDGSVWDLVDQVNNRRKNQGL